LLKIEIFTKLGLPRSSTIELLSGNCGGQNLGVWLIKDATSQTTLVLKLVRSAGQHGASEAAKLKRLAQKHPSLATDSAVAFPFKILSCVDQCGNRSHDFIAMRKAAGAIVGDVIGQKWSTGRTAETMKMLRELGSFLARFHRRYGRDQHGDFQPSNVFFDSSSGSFTLIDVADLGQSKTEGDVAHFVQSLRLVSSAYGEKFYIEGRRHFEEGYMMGA
jgi:hypothetical protein